ncbi:putative S-adenosyl-L-methionine-dependent methyltransferase MidA, partial [Tribonema minus]
MIGEGDYKKAIGKPLVIYEAGGGAGANAGHIMDLLRTRAPDVYATARYTLVQPCAALAERQRLRLSAAHRRQVQVVSGRGVAEWAGALEVDPRPCYVLGLDFLGTLPHDKVAYKRLQEGGPVQLCEAIISDEPDGRVAETYQPLADGSIARVLELCPDLIKSLASPPEHEGLLPAAKQFLRTVMRSSRRVDGAVFVPTG